MARQVTHYRVFIASPGGLEDERHAFREALKSHNEADAIARSCFFEPVGWEITLGGMGRPQQKINEDLRACDYFVLVLWTRWGTPTGADGATSGTHEEYVLARSLVASKEAAMREIVVFFKGVDAAQLSDPGPQLSKVIEFKRSLEEGRELLFESFDTAGSFGEKLKRHLAEWTRFHESQAATPEESNKPSKPPLQHGGQSPPIEEVPGRNRIDLEKQLAFEMTNLRTMESFERYGAFLFTQARFADAERVYRKMGELAGSAHDVKWESTALARLGGALRAQGKLRQAQATLELARDAKSRIGDKAGESAVLGYLGDMYVSKEMPEAAFDFYTQALRINPDLSGEAAAMLMWKSAKCAAKSGHSAQAELLADQAVELATKHGVRSLPDSVRQWRKARRRQSARSKS